MAKLSEVVKKAYKTGKPIKDIVLETIQESESRMKKFVKEELTSEFKIQKMVLDTEFRKVNTKIDDLDIRMSKGFEQKSEHLHEHDIQIATLNERVDEIAVRLPLNA